MPLSLGKIQAHNLLILIVVPGKVRVLMDELWTCMASRGMIYCCAYKEDIRGIFACVGYCKSFNVSHEISFNSCTLAYLVGCVVLQMNGYMDS